MSHVLRSMAEIFEAFRQPVPTSSVDGQFTVEELLRFLDNAAPGYGVDCEIHRGRFITVCLTVVGIHSQLDDSPSTLDRVAVATIENDDPWLAYHTALLRAASMWGLKGLDAKAADLDHLLADVNLP